MHTYMYIFKKYLQVCIYIHIYDLYININIYYTYFLNIYMDVCMYLYIHKNIHSAHTHTLFKHKHLFWMRLIVTVVQNA